MTTGVLCPTPILQFFDNYGNPLSGGSVLTQVGGVNQATYSDVGLTTALPNPIVLNSRGEVATNAGASSQCFLTPNIVYTFTLSDKSGNQINQALYVNGIQITASTIGQALWPRTAAEIAAGITPTSYLYPSLNPFRYGADGTGGANDTTAYAAVRSVLAQLPTGISDWLNGMSIAGWEKTAMETAAVVVPQSYEYPSDGQGLFDMLRMLNATQKNDVLAGTATQDVSGPIQAANDFVEGKAVGAIGTLGSLVAGTGYNGGSAGTFTLVALSGGSGQFATGTVVLGSGGVVSSVTIGYATPGTWVGNPGTGYLLNDILSITSANLVASGASAGGAGGSITVTALATGGKTGSGVTPGGTIIFPSGRYYCGTTGVRLGDMVRWLGTSVSGTRFSWSDSFGGNRITIGPDASGFNGRGGYYAMGSNLERCTVEMGNGAGWGVYTTGLQQNGRVKDVWVVIGSGTTGGVYLQDHHGSANMLCEDTYVFPDAGTLSGTVVGFHCDGGVNLVLERCSCNGLSSGSYQLFRGIEYVGGGLTVRDFQCENAVTHLDISATAGENAVIVEGATFNLAIGGAQGVWIHSGFTGSFVSSGIAVGPGEISVRNDNTNEQVVSQSGGGILSEYIWSGTSTDYGTLHNVAVRPRILAVNAGGSQSLDVSSCAAFDVSQGSTGTWTMAAPTMGINAMPTAGNCRPRILINILNISTGGITTSWASVFKLAGGAWTDPANGKQRSVEFLWNGTVWHELFRSSGDVTT